MKKRNLLTLLLCIVMVCSMFTACGTDAPKENEEAEQETEEKVEEKHKALEGFVYSGQTLVDSSRPIYNNDDKDNYSGEVLTDTGVNYTFNPGEALRSVAFENLSINPADYNTIAFRIRSLTGDDFYRWRIYIHSDLGGNLLTYKDDDYVAEDYFVEILSDGTGTNTEYFSITEPDEDGWITVVFDVGNLNYWKNASVIDGFRIGWVNYGTDQEISEVVLSKQ